MQYINGMDMVKSVYDEVRYLIDSKTINWTDLGEYKECSVQSFENPTEEGLIFKCIGEVDTSPEIPLNVLYNANLQEIWDDLCIESRKIEQLDSCNSVDYYSFGSPLGGAPRDFVFLRNFSIDYENKAAYVVIRSIHHESILNPDSSYMKPSGWQFLEIAPNKTRITLVIQISDFTIAPYLRVNSVDLKQIYRNTGIQITHTLPVLIKYIKNYYQKEIENHFKNLNSKNNNNSNLNYPPIPTLPIQTQNHTPTTTTTSSSSSSSITTTTVDPEHIDETTTNKKIQQMSEEFECMDVDDEILDIHKTPTQIFKECSKTIGEIEINATVNGWNLYRKFNDYSFYYRDYDQDSLDYICSGSTFIDSTPEVISSYLFSEYSCKLDQWTSGMTTIKQIDKVTSLERMKFRSVFNPKEETDCVLVKQVNHLQKGIIFLGFRSLSKPIMSAADAGFWYAPSGYYICPQERGCILRYLIRFRMFIPQSLYKTCSKKKILYIISEKTRATNEIIKSYSINPSYLQKRREQVVQNLFPSWQSVDKFSELADMFSTFQINQQKSSPTLSNQLNNGTGSNNSNENEKKRKFRDNGINSTSVSIPSVQFCFSNGGNSSINNINNNNSNDTSSTTSSTSTSTTSSATSSPQSPSQNLLNNGSTMGEQLSNDTFSLGKQEYLRFVPNWENYVTRKPFLLLMSSGLHLRKPPKKKSPRSLLTHQNLKTDSLFDLLPYEIIQFIFTSMDARHLLRMSSTCKYFNLICSDDSVWRELYNKKYSNEQSDSIFKWSSIEDLNQNKSSIPMDVSATTTTNTNGSNESTPTSSPRSPKPQQSPNINITPTQSLPPKNKNNESNYWINMFKEKEIVNLNWQTGNGRISHLRGHKGKISCLQLAPDQVFTGSRDKEFKSWNIATKQCESTTRSGSSSVVSFEKDNLSKLSTDIFPYCLYTHGIIRLGCSNGAIQHYNLTSKEIEKEQRFIYVSEGFIFNNRDCYSWEANTVKLFDQETEQELQMIQMENTKINHCKIGKFGNYTFVACTDKTIKLWDTDSNKVAQIFTGHKGSVNCIDFFGDYQFVTGSSDKSIRMWDIRNSTNSLSILKGSHTSKVKSISMYNNSRMSSGDEDSICIWDLNNSSINGSGGNNNCSLSTSPKLLSTIKNLSPVECLSMDDETMIAGFSDGDLAYFDFNSK